MSKSSNQDPEPTTLAHILRMLTEHTVHKRQSETSFHVMPDLTQSIGDFDRETDSDKLASEWLGNINTIAGLHKWLEVFKLQTAKQHLKGPARDWILGRLETLSTWQKFETAFRDTFIAAESLAQRFVRMQAYV